MPSISSGSPLGGIPDAFFALLRAQAEWGQDLYQMATGTRAPGLEELRAAWEKSLPTPVCHVPAPCWMPKSLGEVVSHVNECGRACVRLRVTNCDRTRRTVDVRVEGVEGVEILPPSLSLESMQRGTFELCVRVPEGTAAGTLLEALIWVEGCRQHFLRWTVSVGTAGLDSSHEVQVEDCPDYRHHWYDHFYCPRPCPSVRSAASG
jgi:hypothetical protein